MFYTGQKVKITDNTCRHRLEIGSIVTLSYAEEVTDGSWDLYAEGEKWVFDQDDCEPVKGEFNLKQFDFTFRGDMSLEGAEETLLDKICEKFDSNTKGIVTTSKVDDCYKNFSAELENGIELDCEVSWNTSNKEWDATVWQMG